MRSVSLSKAFISTNFGRNLLSSFSTAVLLFAFGGGWVSTAVAGLPPVENIPCLAAPEYNPPNNLNCTSGDVTLSSPFVNTVKACNFPGDTTILEVKFDVTTTATDRYDLGLWFSVDGDPNGDGSRIGICSAVVLPSDIFMNSNPPNQFLTDLDGDTCGDVSKTGTLVPQVLDANLGEITLICSDPDGDGFLDVPVIITWDNTSNNVCNSAQEARPNTGSKCREVPNLLLPVPIPGQITVDKVTVPADATDFQFHLTGPALNPLPAGGFDGSEDFLLNDASPVFDTAIYTGGLTPGVYSVTEDANSSYITTVSCTGSEGAEVPTAIDVSNGETVNCVVTNTLNQATINVVKNTLGGNGAFTIQAVGPLGIDQVTYDFNMDTGVSNTDTVSMDVSPTGAFEVSETLVAGWDLASASCVNDNGGGVVGAWDQIDTIENINLTAGDSITCTFTNAAAGSVSLVKNTIGDDGSFDFVTDVPGLGTNIQTAGGTGGISTSNVPAGVYSIVETVPAGWNLDSASCNDGSPPGALDISNGESVTCTFTNTKLGTVIVEKQTLPDGSGQSFEFTGDVAGNIVDGGQIMLANLLPGTYTSTETAVAGWDLTSIICSDGNSSGDINTGIATFNLEAGEIVTCVFTNTQDGSIEVIKSLAATGPVNELFGFTSSFNGNFNLQGDAATTGPISVTPGNGYTVSEDDPTANGWANISSSCGDGSVPSVDIIVSPGEAVVCTFTNTPLGSATIVKNTIGGDDSFNFTGDAPFDGLQLVTAGGTASQDFTFELDAGQYLVTENPVPAGWALTNLGCVEDGIEDSTVLNPTATINVEYAETVTCTFTNTADGTLIIRKETVPDAALDGFTFTGSANGILHDYSDTAEELTVSGQPGNYTSAETVPAGWVVTDISCQNPGSSVVSIGGTGSFVAGDADVSVDLVAGETVICTFENTREGSITIDKTSVGDVGVFNFTGDLGAFALNTGNANPDSSAFNNLLPGEYMVSEMVPTNWILSGISCQGQNASGITIGGAGGFDPGDLGVTINLAAGEDITCSFTNTKLPSLALVKTVTNDNSGTAVDTDWVLSAAGPTPLSGAGGVAATFVGLGDYTLSESAGPAGYTAGAWNCTDGSLAIDVVTLAAGDVAVCTIINDDDPAVLNLAKSVNGGAIKEANGSYTVVYTITATNTGGPGIYDLVDTFSPGAGITLNTATAVYVAGTENDQNGALGAYPNFVTNEGLAPGLNESWTVTANFTVAAANVTPTSGLCNPGAPVINTGFYNFVSGSVTDPDLTDNDACTGLPETGINLAKTVNGPATSEGNGIYTVEYTITATNAGGPGSYNLVDAFSPGDGITLNTATATYVPGTENDQSGTLGAYPNFVTDEGLADGLNESWTVSASFTVDPAQVDPVTSQCDPANPAINTGFYNAISGSSTDTDPTDNDTCTSLNVASLTLVKVVTGTGNAVPANFALTLTGTDGTHDSGADYQSGASPAVKTGVAYQVTEVAGQVADYVLDGIACIDNSDQAVVAQPFTLLPAQSVTCTVTNFGDGVVMPAIPVPVDNKIALILLTLMLLGTGLYMRPAVTRKPE